MGKADYKEPIERNNGNGSKKKEKPSGLEVDDYQSTLLVYNATNDGPYVKFYKDLMEKLMKAKIRIESEHTYMAILYKTVGYHKNADYISHSQFCELTGLSRRSVTRALDDLQKRNMIIKIKNDSLKNNSHCSYGLIPPDEWRSGVTLEIVAMQGDLFAEYYTKNSVTGATRGGHIAYGVVAPVRLVVTAPVRNTKEIRIYTKETRAREGQGLCKVTTRGLTKEEIEQHIAKHNCNVEGNTCPDDGPGDCRVFSKLNLSNIYKLVDSIGNGSGNGDKTQINGNGKDAGQSNEKGNGNELTAQPQPNNIEKLKAIRLKLESIKLNIKKNEPESDT
ncbi:MAG: replication protein [Nitrospirae bacterium]|nr:replication protein [Nitrospirota bacterium]